MPLSARSGRRPQEAFDQKVILLFANLLITIVMIKFSKLDYWGFLSVHLLSSAHRRPWYRHCSVRITLIRELIKRALVIPIRGSRFVRFPNFNVSIRQGGAPNDGKKFSQTRRIRCAIQRACSRRNAKIMKTMLPRKRAFRKWWKSCQRLCYTLNIVRLGPMFFEAIVGDESNSLAAFLPPSRFRPQTASLARSQLANLRRFETFQKIAFLCLKRRQ